MNQQIKQKWVDALLSGKYKQGMGMLRSRNDKFCCLGVLCDLYVKETGAMWSKKASTSHYMIGGIDDILPLEVAEWAGCDQSPPVIARYVDKRGKMKEQNQTLGDINDFGVRFTTIATYIKEQL